MMLLEAKGGQPLQAWETKKAQCQRVYNKELKTYVFDLVGESNNSIKMPANQNLNLELTQQYIAFQVFIPKDQPFQVTITVETASKMRLRLVYSTSVKILKISIPHARIPLHVVSGAWTNLILDLNEAVALFQHQQFRVIQQIEIAPFCTILRIFTLLNCPMPTLELFSELEQQAQAKNPHLPRPKFSKRNHQPLDSKLATPIPMHIQIVDEFYCLLFAEGRLYQDISSREIGQIIEARKAFMENFNQCGYYEQQGVKITKTNDIKVSELKAEDQEFLDQQQQQSKQQKEQVLEKQKEKRKTISAKYQAPLKVSQKSEAQKQPQSVKPLPQATGSIQATLQQLKIQQQQADEQKKLIEVQVQKINNRNLNEDFSIQQEQHKQEQLTKVALDAKQLQKVQPKEIKLVSKPPAVMKDIKQDKDEGYCAEGIDLTVKAQPVQFSVQKSCKDKKVNQNDRSQLTPIMKVKGTVKGSQVEPAPIEELKEKQQQEQQDELDDNQQQVQKASDEMQEENQNQDEEEDNNEVIDLNINQNVQQQSKDSKIQHDEFIDNDDKQQLDSANKIVDNISDNDEPAQEEEQNEDLDGYENVDKEVQQKTAIRLSESQQAVESSKSAQKTVENKNKTEQKQQSKVNQQVESKKLENEQKLIPNPNENMQENQDLIPEPAENQIIKDPVAFGLEYDPVTGLYYEK